MKTSRNLLDALTVAVVAIALRLDPSAGELSNDIRTALSRVLESYRPTKDDFESSPANQSTEFSGTRRPDADKIRTLIFLTGTSQRALSLKLGISGPALSKALNRERWTFERFVRVADVLGVRVDDIVEGGRDAR